MCIPAGEFTITDNANSGFWGFVLCVVLLVPCAEAQKLLRQRGRVKSFTASEVVLEAVDLPAPQPFVLNAETQGGAVRLGELVQITFISEGDRRIARTIAEIVATPINLTRPQGPSGPASASTANVPTGQTATAAASTKSVNLPHGTASTANASASDAHLPTGSATHITLSSAPISLAATDDQLELVRGPGIHKSGVQNPIRIAILDFTATPSPDLTPDVGTGVSDRLATLLQNDALFTLLDRDKLRDMPVPDLASPAAVLQIARQLDSPDAILIGEIKEEIPADQPQTGPRRRVIQAASPAIQLEAHLYDAHTGHLLGEPHGSGGSEDRPGDHPHDRSSPIMRALRDSVESLALAIDADYPPILDPRTFVTVEGATPGRLTVAFPGSPTVQFGNRLLVSYPTWFTRDPASGAIVSVPAEPFGTLIVTNIERSQVSGTYQGTLPAPGQTVRLSR